MNYCWSCSSVHVPRSSCCEPCGAHYPASRSVSLSSTCQSVLYCPDLPSLTICVLPSASTLSVFLTFLPLSPLPLPLSLSARLVSLSRVSLRLAQYNFVRVVRHFLLAVLSFALSKHTLTSKSFYSRVSLCPQARPCVFTLVFMFLHSIFILYSLSCFLFLTFNICSTIDTGVVP